MGIVYQMTFFVGLGIMGIIVAVFVVTVAQIGKATESATKQQEELLLQQKEAKQKQVDRFRENLEKAKKIGEFDSSGLLKDIKRTEGELVNYNREMERVRERVVLIRRRGAVVFPGVASCVVIVLTSISSGLAESQNLPSVALWLWIASIGVLVYAIYRIFKTLGAIEQVTITSVEFEDKLPAEVRYAKEELEGQKYSEAVLQALRAMEEEKRPELGLEFTEDKPPIKIKANTEKEIHVRIKLIKGNVARNIKLYYFAPSGFEFPYGKTWVQSKSVSQIGGYMSYRIELEDLQKGMNNPVVSTIKAPDKLGTYSVYYSVTSDMTNIERTEFKVIVE